MKHVILRGMLFLASLLLAGMANAQTVSGTVSEPNGPLPGANVLVKGTTNGTTTDFDGNYTLNNVPSNATLVFSYVGFAQQEVAVNGRSRVNITLQEDAAALEEVVVIGYGTTTVRDATGSVSSVTSEDFNGGVISSPEQLIQGKTAGVQISQSSGEPGAGIDIRIRGSNSIRSNNNPLFVVDGVPLSGGGTGSGAQDVTGGEGGSSPSGNPLAFLNPSDIESISILKDASATAIYGSRGANGVVIVTTKSGRSGQGGIFEFSSALSLATSRKKYDLLNRDEFLDALESFGGVNGRDFGSNTDWQDVVLRTTISSNNNLSYSQNYGTGNLRATLGYSEQLGIVENSQFNRLTGRVNWLQRLLDDKLTINVQTTVSKVDDEAPLVTGGGGFRGDVLGMAYSANPTWPNDPNFDPANLPNPRNVLENYQSTSTTKRALLNGSVEYKILPELSAKVNLGYDRSSSTRKSAISANTYGFSTGILGNGRGAVSDQDSENKTLEATLNYTKEFENSSLDILVGYAFQQFNTSGRNVSGWGFETTNLDQMGDGLERSANTIEGFINTNYQSYGFGTNTNEVFVNRLFTSPPSVENIAIPSNLNVQALFTDTYDNTDELQSYFGRINYSLSNKYLFTATIRADGSSRFGPSNQYGYFPSGAFAWKIAEEDFIGDNVSTLKLRLGAGITGNQEGLGYGNFLRRTRYSGAGIGNDGTVIAPGTNIVAFPEPNLKWESTLSYNAGIDFGFNNDRLTGSIDVYRKETSDLLLNIQAAQPSPQPFFFQNIDATVLNQGIEFAIAYDMFDTEDFHWDASFNISYNKNELQDFAGLIQAGTIYGQGLTGAYAQILAGGRPLFSYYLREFGGFDDNGQPIGDIQDFVGKDALPDYNAGLSTNLRYKNWDFSMYFASQFGGFYVYNNTANAFFTAGSIAGGRNVTQDVIGNGESGSASAPVSTRFLEKGDFIRLQNVGIGHNFDMAQISAIESIRVSLTAQNLFVITGYSGLDPEVSTSAGDGGLNGLPTAGIDWTAFPRPTTITLGLNARF